MLNSKLLFSLILVITGGSISNEVIAQQHSGEVSKRVYLNTFDVEKNLKTKVLKSDDPYHNDMESLIADQMKEGRFFFQGSNKSAALVERFSFDSRDFDPATDNFCRTILEKSTEPFLGVANFPTEDFTGVIIEDVIDGTSADAIGIVVGDVLESINGEDVSSPCELTTIIHDLEPGAAIVVHVNRNGNEIDLNGNLGGRTLHQVSWIPCIEDDTTPTELSLTSDNDDLGNTPVFLPSNIVISPNPSNGHFTMTFTSEVSAPIYISIMNVHGRIIFEQSLKDFDGFYNRVMDLDRYAAGVYYLNITQNGVIYREKIIIQ